ncbi:thermonuclease family protein [Sutcliffiella cohnii]
MLLEQGLAKVVVYQPNNKYEEQFRAIERTAQEGKIGIWSIN